MDESKKYYEIRMSICKSCENLIPFMNRCKLCGCFMDIKTKIKDAVCPENKWEPIKD